MHGLGQELACSVGVVRSGRDSSKFANCKASVGASDCRREGE